ncbi:MAG: hypothetical protein GX108_06510 [Thermovirga sp.]|nr:hypothetical protein [Thermovirga sp.]
MFGLFGGAGLSWNLGGVGLFGVFGGAGLSWNLGGAGLFGVFGGAGLSWNLGGADLSWNLGGAGLSWILGGAGLSWDFGGIGLCVLGSGDGLSRSRCRFSLSRIMESKAFRCLSSRIDRNLSLESRGGARLSWRLWRRSRLYRSISRKEPRSQFLLR